MATIKGFNVPGGYMGLVPSGKYRLFETEKDYIDYMNDEEKDNGKKNVAVQTRQGNQGNGEKQRKRKPSEGRPRSLRRNSFLADGLQEVERDSKGV